ASARSDRRPSGCLTFGGNEAVGTSALASALRSISTWKDQLSRAGRARLRTAAARLLVFLTLAILVPQQALAQSAACNQFNADYSSGATITLNPPSGGSDFRNTEYGPPSAIPFFDIGERITWSAQSSGPGDTIGARDLSVAFLIGTNTDFPVELYNDIDNFSGSGSFEITAGMGGYLYVFAFVENFDPFTGDPYDPPSSLTFSLRCSPAAAAPTLTAVAPATGPVAGGTSVTLTGTDLTDATAVTFGGTPAASFTVDSATQITAVTPAHAAGAVEVAVTTPGGSATLAGAFSFEAPGLSIGDVSLAEGNAGTTSFTFTVTLDAPAGPGGVTFVIATADNTATVADGDYLAS